MSAPIVTLRRHKCTRQHQDYPTFIRCAIGKRRVLWMQGYGPYATISRCGGPNDVSVMLHPRLGDAQTALKDLNRLGCGGRCSGNHELAEVVL